MEKTPVIKSVLFGTTMAASSATYQLKLMHHNISYLTLVSNCSAEQLNMLNRDLKRIELIIKQIEDLEVGTL